MIRILFIGMTSNPGGLETYMMNIFSRLQGHGFQFFFVNTSYNKKIAYNNYIKRNKGIIINIPFKDNYTKYFKRYYVIKQFFKHHHNFDIVHINALSINEIYWAKAAKKYGIKHIIFQSHESNYVHNVSLLSVLKRLWSVYNKLYLKRNKSINKLAASYNCGKWMFGKNSIFKIINNGIDTDEFKPDYYKRIYLRNKLNLYNKLVVITTSRLYKQKNYSKIIKVFYYIHKMNVSSRLVIIGSGSELHNIKHLIRVLNLKSCVIFLGVQDRRNIARLLNIGDLMIMPSFYEAVPFSLTEAQSVGVPAIVSKGRIPYSANITGKVIYFSLDKSDKQWAIEAMKLLNYANNFNLRIDMNKLVKKSKFNINNSINRVKKIYISMLN